METNGCIVIGNDALHFELLTAIRSYARAVVFCSEARLVDR